MNDCGYSWGIHGSTSGEEGENNANRTETEGVDEGEVVIGGRGGS